VPSECDLPPEVDRVLDAGVHALAAGWRVDVGGVAGEKHRSVAVAVGDPVLQSQHG
jgi:hypothetical protein